MNAEPLEFAGDVIRFDDRSIATEHPVESAYRVKGRIVVLYDPDSATAEISNLVCLDLNGRVLWRAEYPRVDREDYYYRIKSIEPLVAYSFTSFACEISLDNGRIVKREFFK
ncbi:MAG: hypothetical protein OSB70_19920 [Myxococcota bacterium]|jgi:hypothetical protein|nr:hypothetical protein [Myxococcota bacterium]